LIFKYIYDSDLRITGNKFEVIIDNGTPIPISSSNNSNNWYDSPSVPISAGQHNVKFRVSRFAIFGDWPVVTIDNITW